MLYVVLHLTKYWFDMLARGRREEARRVGVRQNDVIYQKWLLGKCTHLRLDCGYQPVHLGRWRLFKITDIEIVENYYRYGANMPGLHYLIKFQDTDEVLPAVPAGPARRRRAVSSI